MCGITGLVGFNDKALARRMNAAIVHRGPDQDGNFESKGVSLAMRRLSIIDVSHGRQPIFNEDGRVAVMFNGEIYNFWQLRQELELAGHAFATHSDTEVLAHGYEEWGPLLPTRLNGMFAYAIWDESEKKLTLARDRFGKKPLYYTPGKDGSLLFASEIKCFLEFDGFDRSVDAQAVRDYLNLRFIPGPRSIFASVRKLPPGHQLTWKAGRFRHAPYWQLRQEQFHGSQDHAARHIQRLFQDAVTRRLVSEVPLGAFLSGGVDSAAVVAAMTNANKAAGIEKPVHTFSIGFPNTEHDESDAAAATAEQLGTQHTPIQMDGNALDLFEKVVWHADEPLADPTCIPTYVLAREARKNVTVVLTGEGADETFGGYEQYKIIQNARHLRHVPGPLKAAAAKSVRLLPSGWVNRIFRYYSTLGLKGQQRFERFASQAVRMPQSYLELVEIFTDEEIRAMAQAPFLRQTAYEVAKLARQADAHHRSLLQRMQAFEIQYALADNLLMKTDKMCMAASVEARCPYLDHTVATAAFGLPDRYKIDGWKDKITLRKMARNLGLKAAGTKKARFFVPIHQWLDGEMSDVLKQTADPSVIRKRGYFKSEAVQQILAGRHESPAYAARQLWILACLEKWHQQYVDP